MSNTALWTHVKANYDSAGLITLTNIRDTSATAIDDTVGEAASQSVIDLWPAYAQIAYDASDALHVEVATLGVIAILWRRGGQATSIENVKWDEIFGDDGLISKVRRTDPRSHRGPSSNSGVQQASELTSSGQRVRGWSDRESLPVNWLPTRRSAEEDS